MTGFRHLPVKYMLGASLLGSILHKLLPVFESITHSPQRIFFALFAGQITLFSIYAVLIYPFFLSPLRKLPAVKGGIPFFGHGIQMRKHGPGLLAKKWYVPNLIKMRSLEVEAMGSRMLTATAGSQRHQMTAFSAFFGTLTKKW